LFFTEHGKKGAEIREQSSGMAPKNDFTERPRLMICCFCPYLSHMNDLTTWLGRPFPFEEEWRKRWYYPWVGGGIVCLFLFVFRPFGLQSERFNDVQAFWAGIAYGLVTVVAVTIWEISIRFFPKYFNEKNWTVGREIIATLLMLTLIAIGNMLYSHWQFKSPISLWILLNWWLVTSLVGIFPTMLGVFWKQVHLTRRYAAEAKSVTAHLHPSAPQHPNTEIILRGDNQGEQIQLLVYDLLYVEASDNYVTVVYRTGSETRQYILRSTLRKIAGMTLDHPQIFRCHRTYIVNLDQVQQLSGNAQGLRLHIKGSDTLIPVSRTLNTEIKSRLNT
jgi:hypothetical protein